MVYSRRFLTPTGTTSGEQPPQLRGPVENGVHKAETKYSDALVGRRQKGTCPPGCPWRLPSEPMLFANLRIYFADFPECTFLYVPEHSMLGDLMR